MKIQDKLLLAMWSIAYQNQSVFDEALKGRIKALQIGRASCRERV